METEEKIYREDEIEINIPSIIRAWFNNWWLIVLCGLIFGMLAFMAYGVVKPPKYVSETILVVKNDEDNIYAYTDDTTEKLTSQYEKILTSNVLISEVMKELGVEELPGELNASAIEGTNLISLKGVAKNPGDAYRIVKAAVDNYDKVSVHVLSTFSLEVMRKAEIPVMPVNARSPFKYGILGVFLGLAGAACAIAAMIVFRDDIKDEKQVSRLLDTTLFASLYYEKKKRGMEKKAILINSPATSFIYCENVKKMATKLDYKAQKNGHKVFIITSINENEGKSTVAANPALALANKNKKVLLVDCDLRKPALYKIFEKKIAPEMEISSYIQYADAADEIISIDQDSKVVSCLFGTKKIQNADVLLAKSNLRTVIESAREIADYIIIDTPPASVAPDAEIVAEYADGVLMVVKQGGAVAADINDAIDNLQKSGAVIYGCVLNALQTNVLPETGKYSYGYGGRYGKYNNRYGTVDAGRSGDHDDHDDDDHDTRDDHDDHETHGSHEIHESHSSHDSHESHDDHEIQDGHGTQDDTEDKQEERGTNADV